MSLPPLLIPLALPPAVSQSLEFRRDYPLDAARADVDARKFDLISDHLRLIGTQLAVLREAGSVSSLRELVEAMVEENRRLSMDNATLLAQLKESLALNTRISQRLLELTERATLAGSGALEAIDGKT